jgi:hypothetical protein
MIDRRTLAECFDSPRMLRHAIVQERAIRAWGKRVQRRCQFPGYPDIDQHEVDWPLDLTKCLAQIALSQIDETAQTGVAEMRPCGVSLLGLVFGADHHTVASASTDIVAHRSGQIERRDTVGSSNLDNSAGVDGTAELVAELRLVAIQRIDETRRSSTS